MDSGFLRSVEFSTSCESANVDIYKSTWQFALGMNTTLIYPDEHQVNILTKQYSNYIQKDYLETHFIYSSL